MSAASERVHLQVETKPMATATAEVRTISTHILDTSVGRAVANIAVTIYRLNETNGKYEQLHRKVSNRDGRIAELVNYGEFISGIYKLHFDVAAYFTANGVSNLYPFIEVVVQCVHGQHYHIPLLLTPFGYTTYRGT